IGSTEEVSVEQLAVRVLELSANGDPPVEGEDEQPSSQLARRPNQDRIVFVPYEQAYAAGFEDMRKRVPDISKIEAYTGWTPQRSLEDTLLDVVGEFKKTL
ncbi:MAG TPA: hypothetical protein VF498_09980, partial [Anaerolineales bacterium]